MERRNTHGLKKQSSPAAALVSGSLVVDTLFEGTSSIADQIIVTNGKPGKQNLMFTASKKETYFGGSAGNICYGLGLLRSPSFIVSAAGLDSKEYQKHLEMFGCQSRILVDPKGQTSSFFGFTDTRGEQIGVFEPGCYHAHVNTLPLSKFLKAADWKKIKVAIFSPGTALSIAKWAEEFKKKGPKDALIIIDPGQMLAIDFTRVLLTRAIRSADILIMNDSEAHFMKTKLGITHEMLWGLKLKYFIVTEGGNGSTLYTKDAAEHISAPKTSHVIDPTGAGDAYRAGLVHALLAGKNIIEGMKIGSRLGAKCVGKKGPQTYIF